MNLKFSKSKLLVILFLLPIYSLVLLGQTRIMAQESSNSEIDRLYDFYENKKAINLITTHGEIDASVTLEVNDAGKAKSIIIEGVTENMLAMVSHLSNTLNMKVEQGYMPVKNYISAHESYFNYLEIYTKSISVLHNRMEHEMAFSKGEMNFHLIFGLDVEHLSKEELQEFTYDKTKSPGYFWRIELKDTRRAAGLDSSEFVF